MKCQCGGYCDGKEIAKYICEDCGTLYCKGCAGCESFQCDCYIRENIVLLNKPSQNGNNTIK